MPRITFLLLVAPLALAACGGVGGAGTKVDPVSYVRSSAHKSAKAPSEHMAVTQKITTPGGGISLGGSGDFSNRRHEGSLTVTLSAAGKTVKMDEVLAGTTVYVRSPLFSHKLPGGKTWAKLDLQKLYGTLGINASTFMSESPEQAFQQLDAAGNVASVGTETINGVETTHYRLSNLDISKIPGGARIEALAHPTYGPIDVWIGNKDGYVRKESLSVSYSFSGVSATMSMTLNFSSFGEHVSVNVPPRRTTLDVTHRAMKGLKH